MRDMFAIAKFIVLRLSRRLAYMVYVPIHKKLWNRVQNFAGRSFGEFFKIFNQSGAM